MKLVELNTYVPKLRWAVGSNRSHARGYGKTLQDDPEYTLIWVNIRDAFQHGFRHAVLDPDDPTGGENSIGDRVARAKQHWADGGYMNPSVCSMNGHGSFDWGDGRHRMVAAAQMGEVYSPVLFPVEDLPGLEQTGIKTLR